VIVWMTLENFRRRFVRGCGISISGQNLLKIDEE